jgi:hypothetical protein
MTDHADTAPPAAVSRLQPHRAHSARVYDVWLGGKDNFAADRALAATIADAIPEVAMMARANRDFILRATRYLVAQAGIRQFLDIGTGLPTAPNLHQVAQQLAPDTRVVYVDNDPLVLAHARALLTSSPQGRCAFIDADLTDLATILHSDELAGTLDLTRPVAVTFGSVLMLVPDDVDPWAKVTTLMDAMPTGSHLVVSHPTGDMNPPAMAVVAAEAATAGVTFTPRSREDVARFFGDYAMAEPGLVPILSWRPDSAPPKNPHAAYYWAGVGRR